MALTTDQPFVWGAGGAQMTPEQIASQRAVAQALMQQGMDYSPVKHWTQGASRVMQAMLGGYEGYRADEAEKANRVADQQMITGLLGGAGVAAAPAPAVAPVAAPVVPATPDPAITPATPAISPDLTSSIAKVAAARGVEPSYLTRTAYLESKGDVNAANPLSSARGPFQFLKSTARQYGLNNPNDPEAATDAAARLALDNKAVLTQALGREPTAAELYLAHQQGGAGAAKLLANPNAPVESVIGPEAARLNGATPGMTAGQFAQKWTSRFDGTPAGLPGASVSSASAVAAPAATATGGLSGVNPALIQAMTSPYASEGTKKIAALLLTQKLGEQKTNTVDLGNGIGILDARGNLLRTIPKGEPNKGPEFGEIGTDPQTGEKTYGWRDPRTQTITPYKAPTAVAGAPSTIPPVPPGVDPKVWREAHSKNAVADALPPKFDDVQGVRKEVQQLPSYKNLAQAAPIYRSMYETAGSNSRASDLNLVYGLGKIMDPGSVVREGEMVMVKNTAGLPEWLQGAINGLNGGATLTPETRRQILKEAHNRVSSYKGIFDQDTEMYRGIATRSRMNHADVIPDFGEFKLWEPPAKAPPAGAAAATGPRKTKAGVTWSVE